MIFTNSWFNFKNKFSYEYGIRVERQPDIIKPSRKVVKQQIPGKNGNLYIDSDTYDAYAKTVECSLTCPDHIDEISEWLNGRGELIFSNEKEKVYQARVMEQIAFSKIGLVFDYKRFPVIFEVNPIKHSAADMSNVLSIHEPDYSFLGQGTVKARPVITVYGEGDIQLMINGTHIMLSNVSSYITINSEIMDAYKDYENQNMKMRGEFPVLLPLNAKNTVSYMGNVSKIEIIPNWGWI